MRWSGLIHAMALAGVMVPLGGCAAASVPGGGAVGPEPLPGAVSGTCPVTRGWVAWVNAMPGPDRMPALIVEGEVDLPAGRVAALEPALADSATPPAQRFVLRPGPAGVGQDRAGGWRKVRAVVRPAQDSYGSIVVECGGKTMVELTEITRAY